MTEVKTALENAANANFQCVPNDDAPEGSEVLGGVMYKGKFTKSDGKEHDGFQAVINGVEGPIKPGFAAAINAALTANNVVPANYDRPSKWTDIAPPAKSTKPHSLDDLSDNERAAYRHAYDELGEALDKDAQAEMSRREVNFRLAGVVREVRSQFANKEAWKQFCEFAPDQTIRDFLGGKNAVAEYSKAGALLAADGFDADAMLPAGVSGAKGVVTAYHNALTAVAANAVDIYNDAKGRKAYGITKKTGNASVCVRKIIAMMLDDGVFQSGECSHQTEIPVGSAMEALTRWAVETHMGNWPAADDVPTVLDYDPDTGKASVLRKESGGYVAGAMFSLEGPDELIAAVARAFSAYVQKTDAATVADAADATTGAMAAAVKQTKKPFAEWPQDMAAKHLAHILFSRWPGADADDDAKANGRADIDGILEKLGDWADAIYADNATVADILDPTTPESDDDAEDAADADLN